MKTKIVWMGLAALALAALLVAAEEAKTERFVVPLSNPAKPARLEVNSMMGSIKVIGYEGRDVIIEATQGDMQAVPRRGDVEADIDADLEENDDAEQRAAKAAGMKRIPLESAGLEIEEENNVVEVNVESFRRPMDLVIRVPFNTSLELGTMSRGGITVENVSGEIEVDNLHGPVTLTSVSGSVTANTTDGDVKVTLAKVTPNTPMAFSTLHGDLDITFPADIKANVKIETQRGQLFSDFDIVLKQMPQKPAESSRKEGGKFRISLDSAYFGTINGGGPEFQFENFSGNIYLRKKK